MRVTGDAARGFRGPGGGVVWLGDRFYARSLGSYEHAGRRCCCAGGGGKCLDAAYRDGKMAGREAQCSARLEAALRPGQPSETSGSRPESSRDILNPS